MELVLHPFTAQQVERITAAKPQAVLLVAQDGAGKGALAGFIAGRVLGQKVTNHPYVRRLIPDEKYTISVDAVRDLQHFVRLKTTGSEQIRRIIIIEHADTMTTEAQNAFLKLLEEPPFDTMILLTANSRENMLPTILSRVQEVYMQLPEVADAQVFFTKNAPKNAVNQAYFMSGGAPGLMAALLTNEADHPLVKSVSLAKQVLQQNSFERLAGIDQVKQKPDALRLCLALERIAQVSINQAGMQNDSAKIARWHRILRATAEAADSLNKNVQTKLTLTHLMLQL